jgi:IS30 family transposase
VPARRTGNSRRPRLHDAVNEGLHQKSSPEQISKKRLHYSSVPVTPACRFYARV